MAKVLGLDIGGANLKAAHSAGTARTVAFPLWKEPHRLTDKLRELIATFPPFEILAATMTGELCDCFASKRAGVDHIVSAVAALASNTRIWSTRGFLDPLEARRHPLDVAAANWLALATCAARMTDNEPGLLIDIGSTTTDIIPLIDGQPRPQALTDPERLRSRELVYTGARRTPVCALLGDMVAAEWFATTLDVCLALGLVPENPHDNDTADGRPATRTCAHARLAHLLCADAETCSESDTRRLAEHALERQVEVLTGAIAHVADRMPSPPRVIVLSGSGEFLARHVLTGSLPPCGGGLGWGVELSGHPNPPPQGGRASNTRLLSLTKEWGATLSEAACAYALTQLATEDTPCV